MDPMVISMIASAVLGYAKSNQQQEQFKEDQMVQAAKERFGGFTGQQGQMQQRPSTIDPMFQSLIAGAMMGQKLRKPKSDDDAAPTTADQPGSNVGSIGGQRPLVGSPYGQGSYDPNQGSMATNLQPGQTRAM